MKLSRIFLPVLGILFVLSLQVSSAQPKFYPTHWWCDMVWNEVQLIVRGEEDLSGDSVIVDYPGVQLHSRVRFENSHYLALNLSISSQARPGQVKIICRNRKNKSKTWLWELKSRRPGRGIDFAQGVTAKDFIYLLMPDRFSNGDPTNDRLPGMRDQSLDRSNYFHRHGGDIQGVLNHLDYLQDMGVTALWMTPVLENDRSSRSEHGYGFTNQYAIEPRFGGDLAYKNLSDALHARGMKLVHDAVYNHVDVDHVLHRDKPSADWFHQWPKFTQTTYKDQPVFDPYGAPSDLRITQDGWFNETMPDLNQANPYVCNYLIQHAIWSVEEFGIDGFRIDTYLYNDLSFMNRCNASLLKEYPQLSLFGETWVHGTVSQAYMMENTLDVSFKSNLPGVTDFQTNLYGIIPALTQPFGWTEGVNKLYTTLANDILYKNPLQNVNFLDNHDLSRFFSIVGENVAKQKIGLQWLMTCRGIPQMYYGTEILMKGFTNPDGLVRLDFPGGWSGDTKNAFTGEGLNPDEKEVQALVRKLGQYRKKCSALQTGLTMQYVPQNGLYVYFRYDAHHTIMCVMNTAESEMTVDFSRFRERIKGFSIGKDVCGTEAIYQLNTPAKIPATTMWVLELR
jgi:glycosidase